MLLEVSVVSIPMNARTLFTVASGGGIKSISVLLEDYEKAGADTPDIILKNILANGSFSRKGEDMSLKDKIAEMVKEKLAEQEAKGEVQAALDSVIDDLNHDLWFLFRIAHRELCDIDPADAEAQTKMDAIIDEFATMVKERAVEAVTRERNENPWAYEKAVEGEVETKSGRRLSAATVAKLKKCVDHAGTIGEHHGYLTKALDDVLSDDTGDGSADDSATPAPGKAMSTQTEFLSEPAMPEKPAEPAPVVHVTEAVGDVPVPEVVKSDEPEKIPEEKEEPIVEKTEDEDAEVAKEIVSIGKELVELLASRNN
jgi:hypothetical protein